jgi:hypothetical protein
LKAAGLNSTIISSMSFYSIPSFQKKPDLFQAHMEIPISESEEQIAGSKFFSSPFCSLLSALYVASSAIPGTTRIQ